MEMIRGKILIMLRFYVWLSKGTNESVIIISNGSWNRCVPSGLNWIWYLFSLSKILIRVLWIMIIYILRTWVGQSYSNEFINIKLFIYIYTHIYKDAFYVWLFTECAFHHWVLAWPSMYSTTCQNRPYIYIYIYIW